MNETSTIASEQDRTWRASGGRMLTLRQPLLMGILNVTPDSFSDGGAYASVDDAVAAALRMVGEGASIIDVGGESTRPGSQSVSEAEQIQRTTPVIAALRRDERSRATLISIDTTRAAVAEAALDAGADIINDVSAGMDDARMLSLAASRGCGLVLMHRLRKPREDAFSTQYTRGAEPDYGDDVYAVVKHFLRSRVQAAMDAGVDRRAIVIDPGLGFGKSVAQNYQLAARLGELQRELDLPALSAASRKSFLAPPTPSRTAPPPSQRLGASIAITLSHWQMGVRLFRVHDVAAHAQALAAAAIMHAEQSRAVDG
jgi:dihydropteroate synthase